MNAQRIVLAALVGLLSLAGCSSVERTGTAGGEVAPLGSAVSVLVVNDNYSDVNVYAVRGAERIRLGTVTGNSSATLALDRSVYATNDVALVAVPIGGFGSASSGRLTLSPGDTVEFRIMPQINQSSVFVRPPRT